MNTIDNIKKAFTIQLENDFFKLDNVDLKQEHIEQKNAGHILSKEARKMFRVALCGGVFDILHVGHVELLKYCKKQADFLVVVVARDKTVKEKKGTKPIFPESDRLEILNSISYVDCAILGSKDEIKDTIERVQPNIILLGRDQNIDENSIKKMITELSYDIKVIRANVWRNDVHAKSSRIKNKIKANHI